ncbi:prolipoprotein diacylglyceryl transferase [Klebsiella michiganensis]|uniref:Prolipoprotein diacylglyceryl transferase n=1 Tax=Klebsiella michiganensis TaxID=1134687 RepID=A0A7H4M6V4_9ENTR|nr:prolipoprotein diacylglyceryl transferase [Klebsiella michiganensis]
MYLVGFVFAMWLATRRANRPDSGWTKNEVENLLYAGFLGVFLGGRLGYVFFYNLPVFLDDPLYLFRVWDGGMSFHGGLIGVILVMIIFAKRTKRTFFQVSDFIAPLIPFGLGAGRLGNFINGELWGRVDPNFHYTMIFPGSRAEDLALLPSHPEWQSLFDTYGALPRHASQLYELALEGVVLFLILNCLSASRVRPVRFPACSSLATVCSASSWSSSVSPMPSLPAAGYSTSAWGRFFRFRWCLRVSS